MASPAGPERRLARLERLVDAAVAARRPTVMAFSGGLGSLVLGSVARKRTDLTCLVVTVGSAPDGDASERAHKFLDFRVRPLRVTANEALRFARERAGENPGLSPAANLASLPLALVLDAEPRATVLGGPRSDRVLEALRPSAAARARLPIADLAGPRPVRRSDLAALGRLLGIPDAFLRMPARSPAVGSGVRAALDRLAGIRGTAPERLLRPAAAVRGE